MSEGEVVDLFPLSLEIFKVRICSSYTGFLTYFRGLEDAHECNHRDMPLCISHINTVNIIHREDRKSKVSLIVVEPAKN